MKPALTTNEIVLFRSVLASTEHYVEFGCGGSTVMAADLVRGSITSVDSSADWLEKVRQACVGKPIQPRLIHADIGPIRDWGYPTDPTTMPRWAAYHGNVSVNHAAALADLFMIDGRFRVACAMQSLIRCRPDALLLIHDYDRASYHVVEQFARPLAQAERLVLLQRQSNWHLGDALTVLMQHSLDPS